MFGAHLDEAKVPLPADAQHNIEMLQEAWGHTAMGGDGVNDLLALANAAVGIAMGGAALMWPLKPRRWR